MQLVYYKDSHNIGLSPKPMKTLGGGTPSRGSNSAATMRKIKAVSFLLATACLFSSVIGRPSSETIDSRPSFLRRSLLQASQETTFDVRVILPPLPMPPIYSFLAQILTLYFVRMYRSPLLATQTAIQPRLSRLSLQLILGEL